MKNTFSILILLVSLTCRAQFTALEYLTAVDRELLAVQEASRNYVKAAVQGNSQRIEKRRHMLLGAVSIAISNLSALPPFGYDTALRDSALVYLALRRAVITEDFARIVDLGPIADKAFDPMEAYLAARAVSEEALRNSAAAVEHQYTVFAQKNGLTVDRADNSLARELNTAAAVHQYFRQIYNIFFECYKQESYLLGSISANDVSGTEQNRKALQAAAEKGLKNLKQIPGFKGDNRLRDACIRLLAFYKREAATDLASSASLFVEKENLLRMEEARKTSRDIADNPAGEKEYRRAMKHFNQNAGQFNTTFSELDKKRKELLVTWNNTSESFMRRHLP